MSNPSYSKAIVVEKVAEEVEGFLKRRLDKLNKDISKYLNVNPFLMSALRDFHGIRTVVDLAELLFISHMMQGHSTGFGKLIDERILPQVFGTEKLTNKVRHERNLTAAAFNEIDHIIDPTNKSNWSLLSLKAGAWTINDTQAHNIYSSFKDLINYKLYGKEIVVGVFYGNKSLLTNKYDILKGINPRQQEQFVVLKNVRVLAGREFWEWLNGGESETQKWVLEGTKLGSLNVFGSSQSSTIQEAPKILAEEMCKKYGISIDRPLEWEKLMIAINGVEE